MSFMTPGLRALFLHFTSGAGKNWWLPTFACSETERFQQAERFQGTFVFEATRVQQLPVSEGLLSLLLSTLTLTLVSKHSTSIRSSHLTTLI